MAAAGLAASSSNGAAAAVPGRSLRPKQPCRAAVKPSARATPRSCHVDQSAALFPAGGAMVGTASLAGSSSSSNSSSSSSRRSRTVIAAAAPSSHAAATGSSDTLSAAAATTAALLEWMQQQGCVVSGVALEYSQGPAGHVYRELKASQVCQCCVDCCLDSCLAAQGLRQGEALHSQGTSRVESGMCAKIGLHQQHAVWNAN
jgi:hypothetical protein